MFLSLTTTRAPNLVCTSHGASMCVREGGFGVSYDNCNWIRARGCSNVFLISFVNGPLIINIMMSIFYERLSYTSILQNQWKWYLQFNSPFFTMPLWSTHIYVRNYVSIISLASESFKISIKPFFNSALIQYCIWINCNQNFAMFNLLRS